MVARYIDTVIVYRIIAILATDWEDTDAYKLGIIDDKGTPIKKSWELKSKDEKDAYTHLHRLMFKIKRMLNKVPSNARKFATYTTALLMLKEHYNLSTNHEKMITEEMKRLDEEVTNVSSGPSVAGLDANPPGPKDRFNGCAVFDVDNTSYEKTCFPKKKYKRWKNYLGMNEEDGLSPAIRQYATKHPKEGIIVRNEMTGAMRYIRQPTKK